MSFKEFLFHPKVAAGIDACGYTTPTPIQKAAIGPVLEGHDIFGLAQTGTGKTAAFVLPLLQKLLDGPRKREQALIVAPTRELAEQIHNNIETMAVKTGLKSVVIYGGVGKHPQIKKIRSGVEIIVACPGRLLDLINDRAIRLDAIKVLILDEADHMFDKGFLPDIKRIVKLLPEQRQTLVFSATMPKEIRLLAEKILSDPKTVQVKHKLPAPTISHARFQVAKEHKTSLLKHIITEKNMKSILVFTRTKHKAKSLAKQLTKSGLNATSLQGNLSQQQRQKSLEGFRSGAFKIMVATDIAARGIDVTGISHVINYDMPNTAETYTHRTGRTGRAKMTGQAYSFVTSEDTKMLTLIERNLRGKMQTEATPSYAPVIKKEQLPKTRPNARNRSNVKSRSRNTRAPGKTKKQAASNGKRTCSWSKALSLA